LGADLTGEFDAVFVVELAGVLDRAPVVDLLAAAGAGVVASPAPLLSGARSGLICAADRGVSLGELFRSG
jgi:hypothetical protein